MNSLQGSVITVAENIKAVLNQTPLLAAIGCGFLWQQWLDDGLFANESELAKHLGKEKSFVSLMLQLALLSPEIIHLAIIGALPEHYVIERNNDIDASFINLMLERTASISGFLLVTFLFFQDIVRVGVENRSQRGG